MPATEEQKAILSVLSLLLTTGEEWTRRRQQSSKEAKIVAGAAKGKFTPLSKNELKSHILHGGKCGQFGASEAVYIKPPARENSAVAALWCRWNFNLNPASCWFHFGIWSAQPSFPTSEASDGRKYPAFMGFRYEAPETGENHNYYHVQPCRTIGPKDNVISQALPISQRNPTWPLPADSSLDLLLCLVTSLYGMKGVTSLAERVQKDPVMRNYKILAESFKKILKLQKDTG